MYLKEIGSERVDRMVSSGSCEHDNECSGFIKCGEFLDYPRNNSVPKV